MYATEILGSRLRYSRATPIAHGSPQSETKAPEVEKNC